MNKSQLRVATVPGSKSITNRALLLAALSDRKYLLKGAQFSDDSRHFLNALKTLGFSVREDEANKTVLVSGTGGRVPKKNAEIYVGSAGTAARFLTAMLAFSDGVYTVSASEQMTGRPMKPLFDALTSLGAQFIFLKDPGHLPVCVRGMFCAEDASGEQTPANIRTAEFSAEHSAVREVSLDIRESTQYLSALLMTASMLPGGLSIHITGPKKSGSYIEITRRMMEDFGIRTDFDGESYTVMALRRDSEKISAVRTSQSTSGETGVRCRSLPVLQTDKTSKSASGEAGTAGELLEETCDAAVYRIEPDVSAACYFYAAAMLTGGSVQVRHVHRNSMQGDMKFLSLLVKMGAALEDLPDGICMTAPAVQISSDGEEKRFPGVKVNMNDFSDQAITLAALAPFAATPTEISGIAHIRHQESDRLHGIAENLTRMGIAVEEAEDSVKIYPGMPKPCEIETWDDHRMAMGFALVALKIPGMTIRNPECCRKTFREYFEEMERVFGLKFAEKPS